MSFFVLLSCEKERTTNDPEIVTASIVTVGDISDVSYTPLSKADGQMNYLLIKVYVFDSLNQSYSNYAYGAFTDLTGITINLVKGSKYKFCASYVPRWFDSRNYLEGITNYFSYGATSYSELFTGPVRQGLEYIYSHPLSERYYCEYEDIFSGNETISLNMKRCSSKLVVSTQGLLVGAVRSVITFEDNPDIYHEQSTKASFDINAGDSSKTNSLIFALKDATQCWNDDTYYESYNVSFYYEIGDSELLIGTKELNFYRNTATNVEVKINNSGLGDDGHNLVVAFDSDYGDGGSTTIDYSIW